MYEINSIAYLTIEFLLKNNKIIKNILKMSYMLKKFMIGELKS